MYKKYYLTAALSLLINTAFGQFISTKTESVKQQFVSEFNLLHDDVKDLEVTDDYIDQFTGFNHIYVRQQVDHKPVFNLVANAVVIQDKVVYVSKGFQANLNALQIDKAFTISAEAALSKFSKSLNTSEFEEFDFNLIQHGSSLIWEDTSVSDIPVKIEQGFYLIQNAIKSCYFIQLYTQQPEHMWYAYVSASSGETIFKSDLIVRCSFDSHNDCAHNNDLVTFRPDVAEVTETTKTQADARYQVFNYPIESPSHGNRTVVDDPADTAASPYGWHDVNGAIGNEFTTTRGNNVWAQEDKNANNGTGYSVEGGSGLVFAADFSTASSAANYLDASIINLFYWNNLMHDVWYLYGFDEVSGNFQENNYNNGGNASDHVFADAQDGSGTNNANFNPLVDGQNPRMQMFLWGNGSTIEDYFQIDVPASIANKYGAAPAVIGGDLTTSPIKGELIMADDGTANGSEGCNALINNAALSGNIAVFDRGNCSFVSKFQKAQDAGAIGIIVINNVASAPINMRGTVTGLTIPGIMISQANGATIKARMASEQVVGSMYDSSRVEGNFTDSDFDNGVIAHEYTHGISTRLTGGPSNSTCLQSNRYQEQMGEGWSDFLGLIMTQHKDDTPEKRRGIGTYLRGQSTNGGGIRPYPYSTSFAVNPSTYDYIKNTQFTVPHGVGSVWCTMLWDLHWAFINEHGYDEDIYRGTGGNNIMMRLVLEAMKLQPCGPGFVDGRDAILRADEFINGGENKKLIWTAFAKRGLGYSADQGTSASRADGVEAFDLPPFVDNYSVHKTGAKSAESNETIEYTIKVVNRGGVDLPTIEVYDSLGDEAVFVTSDGRCNMNINPANNTFLFTISDLKAGDSVECGYTVKVDKEAGGKLVWIDDVEQNTANWIATIDDGSIRWLRTQTESNSGFFSWFIQDIGQSSDGWIENTFDLTELANPNLIFSHFYATEGGNDGGVVEILVNGDWIDLGMNMTMNGYNATIDPNNTSRISGRPAFSGNSNGFVQTIIDLSFYQGNVVNIRFRMVSDPAVGSKGWYIDDIALWNKFTTLSNLVSAKVDGDVVFDITQTEIIKGDLQDTVIVPNIDVSEKLQVFPNPIVDDVTVNFESKIDRSLDLHLFNSIGKDVWFGSVQSNKDILVPTSHLAAGIYHMEVSDGDKVHIFKLFKQ
ncbi:MAG: extracellular elastinolytic metalloproteinase [Bacteroidia bacterium]|jgi:extracellular elastinolytic metalloproteinase